MVTRKEKYTFENEKKLCRSFAELKPVCVIRITDKTIADYNKLIICNMVECFVNGAKFEENGNEFFIEWDKFKLVRIKTENSMIQIRRGEIVIKTW